MERWHPTTNQHDKFTSDYWRSEVYNKDTVLGYHEWVEHQIEAARDGDEELKMEARQARLAKYEQRARDLHVTDEVEIDDVLNYSKDFSEAEDEGCWVRGWLWVAIGDIEEG